MTTRKKEDIQEMPVFDDTQKRSAKEFIENLGDKVQAIYKIQPLFIWEAEQRNLLITELRNDFMALIDSGVFVKVNRASLPMDKREFMNRMVRQSSSQVFEEVLFS